MKRFFAIIRSCSGVGRDKAERPYSSTVSTFAYARVSGGRGKWVIGYEGELIEGGINVRHGYWNQAWKRLARRGINLDESLRS